MAAPSGGARPGRAAGTGLPVPVQSAPSGPAFITSLAGGGTGYFADQHGNPRFLLGDNPWALIPNAGRWAGTYQSDIDTYCDTRGGQGFTGVYLDPLGNTELNGAFPDGRTWDGVFPFTVNGVAGSTASLAGTETIGLNSAFWTRVDYFIAGCARNGMTAMLNVGTNGPGDFDTGAALTVMTPAQFSQYGAALAARYAATQNIIWMVGNDYFGGTGGTFGADGGTPANADSQYASLHSGLSGGGDAHLFGVHNYAESDSREDLGTGTTGTVQYTGNNFSSFNGNYTYNLTYLGIEDAYGEASPVPVMQLDGYFYQGGPTYEGGSGAFAFDRAFRQDAWQAVTSGARGHVSGSEGVWEWGSGALAQVQTGWYYVNNAAAIRTLTESLPNWYSLIPDTGNVLITGGRGTRASTFVSGGSGGQYEVSFANTYVSASRCADKSLAILYFPSAATITIDQSQMVAGYKAYWADPVTGTMTLTTSGSSYNSASPGSNSQGDPDWVLVLKAP